MSAAKRDREEGEGAGPKRGGGKLHSLLDTETSSYYAEINERFGELDDAEEKTLLAENALGEASGKEAEIACDAACSRVLERLLPHAGTEALCAFTRACVEGESLGAMCTSGPFGSHVLEKCLIELARRAGAGDSEWEAVEAALTAVTEACSESLFEMATSKYGSFVARRLLCVLSGRDVAPAPGKKQEAPAAGGEQQGGGMAPRGGGALAAKLGGGGEAAAAAAAGGAGTADYPALLDMVATAAMGDDWSKEEVGRLATDSFAGPFLQALLRACTHNQKLQQRLLLHVLGGTASKGMESVSMDRCHALMQDRQGSHLMEAVFATAPDDYFAKLSTLCFKGHLLSLAQHSTANFAVQAAIAALRKPQQLKRMFEDLKPNVQQLLRSRRSGVIAAMLAAAGRLGTQEAEMAAALWAAASTADGGGAGGSPVASLLTLDTHTKLGQGGRLSTLGCAMLGTLLRLPTAACKQWAEAVGSLPPGQLQHVAKDPGGCRVLEAYLEGPGAAAKRRRALLQGLAGSYGEVAMGGSGSHFVEKCYALAEVKEKETIAGELAAAEPRLMTTHRGPTLLKRCHVDAFKKGSDGWQKRVAAADAARREFEDIFGEGGEEAEQAAETAAEEQEQEEQPQKKKKGGKKAAATAAAEPTLVEEGGSGKKKKKKSEKTAAEAAQQQQQAEEEAGGKKAKKRQQEAAVEQPAAKAEKKAKKHKGGQ